MKRHLRPTSPLPRTPRGLTLLDDTVLATVRDLAGYDAVGVYVCIVSAAQGGRPCTLADLETQFPLDADAVVRAAQTLVAAGVVAWQDEGGCV